MSRQKVVFRRLAISVSDKRFSGVLPLTRIDEYSKVATFPLSFNSLSSRFIPRFPFFFPSVLSLRIIIQAGSQRFHSGGLPHQLILHVYIILIVPPRLHRSIP